MSVAHGSARLIGSTHVAMPARGVRRIYRLAWHSAHGFSWLGSFQHKFWKAKSKNGILTHVWSTRLTDRISGSTHVTVQHGSLFCADTDYTVGIAFAGLPTSNTSSESLRMELLPMSGLAQNIIFFCQSLHLNWAYLQLDGPRRGRVGREATVGHCFLRLLGRPTAILKDMLCLHILFGQESATKDHCSKPRTYHYGKLFKSVNWE